MAQGPFDEHGRIDQAYDPEWTKAARADQEISFLALVDRP
jgi:hypothetical protein